MIDRQDFDFAMRQLDIRLQELREDIREREEKINATLERLSAEFRSELKDLQHFRFKIVGALVLISAIVSVAVELVVHHGG